MFRLEGHRIGDSWYYAEGDTVHAWFLTMPIEQNKGWRIDHCISGDLVHWEYQGTALEPGPADAWDGKSLATGSIGMAQSTDMIHWETLPPPEHDRMTEEMEVPQVYLIDGRYYLVFCTHDFWLAPSFRNRFPGHPFRSADYAMVGDTPLGPFRIHGTGEIIPKTPLGRFYASQLVALLGEWFLLGTEGIDAESGISNPLKIVADETGIHVSKE